MGFNDEPVFVSPVEFNDFTVINGVIEIESQCRILPLVGTSQHVRCRRVLAIYCWRIQIGINRIWPIRIRIGRADDRKIDFDVCRLRAERNGASQHPVAHVCGDGAFGAAVLRVKDSVGDRNFQWPSGITTNRYWWLQRGGAPGQFDSVIWLPVVKSRNLHDYTGNGVFEIDPALVGLGYLWILEIIG
ncbi:hypothetical protein D1006_35040 [Burkholderia stabilis]|uniref:Uncharacterized protein n=1 Tax=Burkholderia stabilis TaxID=95485 RepID=A0A4Q2A7E2_9BURK|nr:hypothetical protein D1006_35040 [Burkholderia stabilis]